jgi:hypothetical protein
MRFRTVSKMLVAAVLAGSGCGGRQHDANDTHVVTPPPAPVRPEDWTRVNVPALMAKYAPVPADALGVYVRTPSCTNCIETGRGPDLYEACKDSPCAVPMNATDPFADRLLYLTAEGHVQVLPWSALAPVVERLIAERGAAARDDAEIAVLRTLRDGGRLARSDAWVEITTDGKFVVVDGFPGALWVDAQQGIAELPAGQPVPAGVAVPIYAATEADPTIAAAAKVMQEQLRSGEYQWAMKRTLARGELVTFGSGGGCTSTGTASFVVEDGVATMVDQIDPGLPGECRPRGRRPEGLASRGGAGVDGVARWYAEAMHMEAASVPAFERLAAELAALGAPARLVRAARAAARDEVRHATVMARLGAWAGATATEVVVDAVPARSFDAVAIENAVEGCVNEGFAAVLCEHQACTATDAALRGAMIAIARDEQAHAGLAFAIADWLDAQLTPRTRDAIVSAVDAALDSLPELAAREATRFASGAVELGLPTPDGARALAHGYAAWVRARLSLRRDGAEVVREAPRHDELLSPIA